MKETFKDNRIYPLHFMYDTGLIEEIKDVIQRLLPKVPKHQIMFISEKVRLCQFLMCKCPYFE